MRLVAKHKAVGYLQPSDRPGCRNCAHFEAYRPESGVAYMAPRYECTKHDLEVTSGGICDSHRAQGKPMSLDFLRRQRDLLDHLQAEKGMSPTWGTA